MIQYFIKKSVITICLNLSILLIGFFSLEDIANEFIPSIEIPAVGVVFPTTVVNHNQVIDDLIYPIEKRLLATGEVEKIETTLEKDRAIVFIFYKWSLRPSEGLQRARQEISAFKRPEGVLEPIFVLHRPTLSPIYRVAIHGESLPQLTQKIQKFSEGVQRLPGVAQTQIVGGAFEKADIQYDPIKATKSHVSTSNLISSAYNSWSFRHLIPSHDNKITEYFRVPLNNIEDLKNLPIRSEKNKNIPLKWVAKVSKKQEAPQVLFNQGQEALILEVIKSPGSDALKIVDNVNKELKKLMKKNSQIKTTVIYNEAEKIQQAQMGVVQNFIFGVALNSLILIIFLGSIIGAVVASCVFPTAILGTLYIMKISDISLNIFALNGFSLASGMITDASIVVLESIMQRFQRGQSLQRSCDKGTKDVLLGVFASTLTTAAVIVPISIQSGVSSKLFSDLGVVLVATQFISLIAVFTFVPWLCSKILKQDESRPFLIEWSYNKSRFLVDNMVRFGRWTLFNSVDKISFKWGLPIGITLASLFTMAFLPDSELLPNVAANTYSLSIPVKRKDLKLNGEELQKTLSKTIGSDKNIKWSVSSRDSDTIKALFKTKDLKYDVKELLKKISTALSIPFKKVFAITLGPTPPTEPMNYDGYYYLKKDLTQNKKEKLIHDFCNLPGIYDCTSEAHYKEPKSILKPQPLNMARFQINVLQSTLDVASLTKNLDLTSIANLPLDFPTPLKINNSDILNNYPLIIGKNKNQISNLNNIYNSHYKANSNVLFRKNSQSYSPLYFRLNGITIGQAVTEIEGLATDIGVEKHELIPMGSIETMNDTFQKMIQALILSFILILLVLVFQFKSISQALIIMYSMPLSLGGAILGLLIMQETLNVGVIVGFILLIGIIVNNGILLMDAINQRLSTGYTILKAVQESVESRTRPILMTTFSTVFGMLPTLLLEAEGKELYRGMAIVNIFGMIFGTFLTLVVTPIVIKTVLSLGEKNKESKVC